MIPFGQFPTLLATFSKLGPPQKRWLGRKRPSPGKPPILPPAKTKLYQIIPAKWMPPADVADLLWRRHAYNNAVLSMRRHFRDEYEQQKSASIGFDLMQKQVNEELDRLLAENDQRNAELAEARAERERETLEKLAEETLLEMERRLDVETQNVKEKSVEVLDMIERSKDFVTKENMEEKIRLALDNPVNFEYAIDLRYNKVENPLPAKYLDSLQQLKQTGRAFDYTGGFGSWKRKPSLARPRRLPSSTGGNEESSEPKPESDSKE